jgi:iron complex outermembrane receptor protein
VWHNETKQDVSNAALEFSKKAERLFIDSGASWTGYEEEYKDMHTEFTDPDSVYFDDKAQDTYTFTLSGGYSFDFAMVSYIPSIGLRLEDINFDQGRSYPYDPGKDTASKDLTLMSANMACFGIMTSFLGKIGG